MYSNIFLWLSSLIILSYNIDSLKFYISEDNSLEIASYVSYLLFLFYSMIYSKFAKDSPTSLNFTSLDKSLFFANFFAALVYESND